MAVDANIQAAYAGPEPDTLIRECLEFTHSLFAPLYIVNDYGQFVYGAITYLPYPFEYDEVSLQRDENPEFTARLSNIARIISTRLLAALASENEPIAMAFKRYVTVGANTYLDGYPLSFCVKGFREDGEFMELTCIFHDLTAVPFPSELFTTTRFPGLGT